MLIISEWKRRPKGYGLKYDEKMAMVIDHNQTKHVRLDAKGSIIDYNKPDVRRITVGQFKKEVEKAAADIKQLVVSWSQ